MISYKKIIFYAFLLMFFSLENAFAQTCYDPRYGNYECNESYDSNPDQGALLMEGALIGVVIGGFASNDNGNNWGGGHGHNGGQRAHGGGDRGGHHH